MVKYYELLDLTNDDGPRAMINAHEEGEWVKRADYEKLRNAARKALKSLNKFGGDTPLPERYGQTALAELEELLRD